MLRPPHGRKFQPARRKPLHDPTEICPPIEPGYLQIKGSNLSPCCT
jgi:hypothetical protein